MYQLVECLERSETQKEQLLHFICVEHKNWDSEERGINGKIAQKNINILLKKGNFYFLFVEIALSLYLKVGAFIQKAKTITTDERKDI